MNEQLGSLLFDLAHQLSFYLDSSALQVICHQAVQFGTLCGLSCFALVMWQPCMGPVNKGSIVERFCSDLDC